MLHESRLDSRSRCRHGNALPLLCESALSAPDTSFITTLTYLAPSPLPFQRIGLLYYCRRRKFLPIIQSEATSKQSLPRLHSGQSQLPGRSSNEVPGPMPLSGSPSAGSYMYPHTVHSYFSIRSSLVPCFPRQGLLSMFHAQ